MAYATALDFIDRYSEAETIQLTDRDEPRTGAVVYQVLERALDDASALIDATLASAGIPVPLASPPALINFICTELARCNLYDDHAPDTVKDRCMQARELLDRMARNPSALMEGAAGDIVVRAPCAIFDTEKEV